MKKIVLEKEKIQIVKKNTLEKEIYRGLNRNL